MTAPIVAALLAGVVGGAAAWRMPGEFGSSTGDGRSGLPRWLGPFVVFATALLLAGAVGFISLVGLIAFGGLDFFGFVRLAYIGLCVSVPMVGLVLVVRVVRGGLPRWSAALSAALLLPVPLGAYATHVEPYRLGVDEATYVVEPQRAGDSSVRIGVLADLQTDSPGSYEREAIDRLLDAEPDIILIPGDIFQGTDSERDHHLETMRDLLSRLEAPGGVYFVYGDTDGWDTVNPILDGLDNIVVLADDIVEVPYGDRRIIIGGIQLHHRSEAAMETVDTLVSAPEDGTIRILVAHRPDVVLDLPDSSRIDLTVAGHTHGGQVVLPWVGPLITMSDVPRQVAQGGLHELAGNSLYVSTGVGVERGQAPQVRFLSPPTVGVIDLVEPS